MRADRLISILLLLQVHQRMTANELAQRLEVSERTIYRDMDALSAAGVPVVADRGVGGGWYLLDDYETNLTGLNLAEVQTLFLSTPDHLLNDLGLHQAAESALNKLLASLPAMHRRDAEYVRQRVHVDGPGSRVTTRDDIAFLPTLQSAIWEERKVQMTYHLSTGPVVECELDPLGLVARWSVWYLVAGFEGEINVYRVSRIKEATVMNVPCQRPKDFNLSTFWEQSSERFKASRPRYPVTVQATVDSLSRMRHSARHGEIEHVGTPNSEGWARVSLVFETEKDACEYLLGFGPRVEVIEPQRLRDRIIDEARQLVGLYVRNLRAKAVSSRPAPSIFATAQ